MTIAAAAASFCTVFALCNALGTSTQPSVVAAILAIGMSRRPPATGGRERWAIPLVVAGVALVAVAIGSLMRTLPLLGAAVFVAGMFLSIWLRNFGDRERRLGAIVALPLVAMLVVPPLGAPGRAGLGAELIAIVCAGVVPLAFVLAFGWIAKRAGLPPPTAEPVVARKNERGPSAALSIPTRMALQMAVALSLAFAVGFVAFPEHWGWAVLTAFIVCSGARGRGDAAYKGALRLAGALAGTLAAAVLALLWAPSGVAEAVAIFVVLFFGLWWRSASYAYWACAMTLVLAMLAHTSGRIDLGALELRLLAILAGAVCAVAATWFVFPIKTTDVIRRRLADALTSLDDLVTHAHAAHGEPSAQLVAFESHLGQLDAVATPARLHRIVADHPEHPSRWIDALTELRQHAYDFAASDAPADRHRAEIRKAIGASRRAIANHGKPDAASGPTIGTALANVRSALAARRGRAAERGAP